MLKIAIVTGSTRPGRNNEAVARWAHEGARGRKDAEFELVDIADYKLPLLDEPGPRREKELHTVIDQVVAWSEALRTVREKK
jgi:NAD(P)H-dependent FMN reductase